MTWEEIKTISAWCADWWTDRLKKNSPHDNGSSDLASASACALADSLKEPVTDNQLAVFRKELDMMIRRDLTEELETVEAYSDYGPDLILSDAARYAGIACANFPYKCGLFVNGTVITVFSGYRKRQIMELKNGKVVCSDD